LKKNQFSTQRGYPPNDMIVGVRPHSDIVQMDSPEAVLNEVQRILRLISPQFNIASITSAFSLTVNLFNGDYPGYRACNTEYHDLQHTINAFLAMARLIHGAVLEGETLTERHIVLGLIAALFHDAGYIQEKDDTDGTGSKYTAIHVQRSMNFIERHGGELGLSDEEITEGRRMMLCTDLAVDISAIPFPSTKVELLGKMLGAADLIAQMADRAYLEKLLFLYHEFREAKTGDYESEVDLLRKTVAFNDFMAQRLETMLDAIDRFMNAHIASRWGIHVNLYHEAIENQKNYLRQILEMQDSDPRDHLRRGGVVDKVRRKYGSI